MVGRLWDSMERRLKGNTILTVGASVELVPDSAGIDAVVVVCGGKAAVSPIVLAAGMVVAGVALAVSLLAGVATGGQVACVITENKYL